MEQKFNKGSFMYKIWLCLNVKIRLTNRTGQIDRPTDKTTKGLLANRGGKIDSQTKRTKKGFTCFTFICYFKNNKTNIFTFPNVHSPIRPQRHSSGNSIRFYRNIGCRFNFRFGLDIRKFCRNDSRNFFGSTPSSFDRRFELDRADDIFGDDYEMVNVLHFIFLNFVIKTGCPLCLIKFIKLCIWNDILFIFIVLFCKNIIDASVKFTKVSRFNFLRQVVNQLIYYSGVWQIKK